MPRPGASKRPLTGQIRLDGGEDVAQRPSLVIHAVGEGGEVLASSPIGDDGRFSVDEGAVAKARRIVLTGKDGSPADRERSVTLRPAALVRAAEVGELAIPARDWLKLINIRRCVDATIRRCFPWRFVVDDLVAQARSLPPTLQLADALTLFPVRGCAPVCEGRVEVFRRTCCCRRIVIDDLIPRRPPFEIPEEFPIPIPFPFPEPDPPVPVPPPGPGPDPAPFDLQEAVLTGGALDAAKVGQLRLRSLAAGGRMQLAFPGFRLCTCGPAVKVAEGFVGEGGNIHICWWEPLRLVLANCHDEYAFVVRQSIGGSTVTIYDGLAAGQWFDAGDDDIRLTSYHPKAVGCREEEFPVPVPGAFVVLQDIGSTESHRLLTPLPDGPDSVQAPGANSGLLDLADGNDPYALGGDLQLRYHFSEIAGASMQALGARYYRVQWIAADVFGDPAGGDWETLPVPAWKTWQVSGGTITPGSHALGPLTVGAESELFHIPFDTGAPLLANEEWQDGQFHAVVPTTSKVQGRYLVRIEVFDAAGNRLEPGAAPFTYRRWDTPTTTAAVNFGALTHLIRTDNRPVTADIVDVVGPGAGAGDCKFFLGGAGAPVTIQYRAFHPQPGSPSFMLSYRLRISRGISGTPATPDLTSTTEVGEAGPPAGHAVTIGDLLDGEDKCSFAVNLWVAARIHNGSGRLSGLDRHDVSAFAVELA